MALNFVKNEFIDRNAHFVPSDSCLNIINAINKVLQDDKQSKTPLFLKIDNEFLFYLIQNILTLKNKSFVVAVAGESACGKTTFVKSVIEMFSHLENQKHYTSLSTDDYYFDTSKELKAAGGFEGLFQTGFSFDTPKALNLELLKQHLFELKQGRAIKSPSYDFVTCESIKNKILKKPAKIILTEGLFTLNEKLLDIMDVKIYIDTPFEVIKERWYKRAKSRGKEGKACDLQFQDVNKSAFQYIRPTRKNANVIVNGLASSDYIKQITGEIVNAVEFATRQTVQ